MAIRSPHTDTYLGTLLANTHPELQLATSAPYPATLPRTCKCKPLSMKFNKMILMSKSCQQKNTESNRHPSLTWSELCYSFLCNSRVEPQRTSSEVFFAGTADSFQVSPARLVIYLNFNYQNTAVEGKRSVLPWYHTFLFNVSDVAYFLHWFYYVNRDAEFLRVQFKTMIPFVVVGVQRTGITLITTLLGSHPGIRGVTRWGSSLCTISRGGFLQWLPVSKSTMCM